MVGSKTLLFALEPEDVDHFLKKNFKNYVRLENETKINRHTACRSKVHTEKSN